MFDKIAVCVCVCVCVTFIVQASPNLEWAELCKICITCLNASPGARSIVVRLALLTGGMLKGRDRVLCFPSGVGGRFGA